jgi:signal transduction histidine kinase
VVLRPTHLTLGTAFLAGGFTLFTSVFPFVDFAYRSGSAHVAVETTASLAALLVAYLVWGRFRQSRRSSDLLLVAAFAFLGVSNLFFAVIPAALPSVGARGSFATWASLSASLLGTTVLAASAFVPPHRRVLSRRTPLLVGLAGVLALAVTAAVVAALSGRLPVGIDPGAAPEASAWPQPRGNPAILAVQVAAALLFAAAAVGFTRRANRTRDELTRWLAVGATLGAFARVNYFLFPSLYTDWVYTGDLLRAAFYLVLVVGAAREIAAYQARLALAAVTDERRRVARNLHDGLAQELNFIVAQLRRRTSSGDPELLQVLTAAERALDESRRAITALAVASPEPFEKALARAAEEVAGRIGAHVDLDLETGIEVEPDTREALVRIVREAVTNAGRHGGAANIAVRLAENDGVRLGISDDGRGFDPANTTTTGGFGLESMRERVDALGGRFRLESQPGEGTRIEIVLP